MVFRSVDHNFFYIIVIDRYYLFYNRFIVDFKRSNLVDSVCFHSHILYIYSLNRRFGLFVDSLFPFFTFVYKISFLIEILIFLFFLNLDFKVHIDERDLKDKNLVCFDKYVFVNYYIEVFVKHVHRHHKILIFDYFYRDIEILFYTVYSIFFFPI